ncbi:MAG: neutral zinc metallopeptidase [Bacteroidales bacterium]|nr:neutral zinc metallopeptidase [Bacteroidales bacterium]
MKLSGRRSSSNVEDRRGQRVSGGASGGSNIVGMLLQMLLSGKKGGITGIIAIVIVVASMFFGGDGILGGLMGTAEGGATEQVEYNQSAQEKELFEFSSKILAGTEDVWSAEFQKLGKTYRAPKLVIFKDAVRSGCGSATSSTGPFYCSADQTVYLDLSFFMSMKKQLGADGDFAYAYVIAHEVGHHVQYLLGTLDDAHKLMNQYGRDTKESNQISVRLELQADFYAGLWAYHDNLMFDSIEDGDIDEGLNAAQKIGDDYLQKKARGYSVPDSFNHGTSDQRSRWLKKGIRTGDIRQGDTFSQSYNSL